MISANITASLYLVTGILFIMALRGLSSPETSRTGNFLGILGMGLAVIVTLLSLGDINQIKENIGISVTIEPLPFDVLIERFATGQTDFTRTAWIADFPDASNFLWLFYGNDFK